MKKYSKELISNYILGEDIIDYEIEELENDKEFMMQVINTTNDYKFYNLCSEELKTDYEFVKYMVLKFCKNTDFICRVADKYLNNNDGNDRIAKMELAIIMSRIIKRSGNFDRGINYYMMVDALYSYIRVETEMVKRQLQNQGVDIEAGFFAAFDACNHSDIVMKYFARRFTEDLFREKEIDIEKLLHKQFKKPEEINEVGINKYILGLIEQHDSMLASYLSANINLIRCIHEKVKKFQNNWEKYMENWYNSILDEAEDYIDSSRNSSVLATPELFWYICKKLGILDKMSKYTGITNEDYDERQIEEALEISGSDRLCYQKVTNMIASALSLSIKKEYSPKQQQKIIEYNFKNKK